MILPKKQPPAEWPEEWDEETKQLADIYEAVPSDPDWLDGIEDEGLLPVLPEPLPDHDAPLVASFWLEHLAEHQQLRDSRLRAEVEGPHAGVWRYLESIESEIVRLTQACRTSTGLERESNLRQLREAEQGRSTLTRSHEFCEALRYRIEATDSKIANCANPTREQQAAARWWGGIRTDWMRFMESILVESQRSTLAGSDGDTAPTAGTNIERGHCQPEATMGIADGEVRRLGNQVAQTAPPILSADPVAALLQPPEPSPKSETPAAPSGTVTQRQAIPCAKASAKPQGVPRDEIIKSFKLPKEWGERLRKVTSGSYQAYASVSTRQGETLNVWTMKGRVGGDATLYSPARIALMLTQSAKQSGSKRPLRNITAVSTVLENHYPQWLDEWDRIKPDEQK